MRDVTVRAALSRRALAGVRAGAVECRDLALVWVHAVPRLARAGWFVGGLLALVALQGIRRILGHAPPS